VNQPPRVLVVEDDLHTQNIVGQILTRDLSVRYLRLQVSYACDGEEGLARFRELLPDLVITDLLMPKLDGFKLVEQIRSHPHGRSLPILVLSAVFRDKAAHSKLERDYRVSFQAKPFSPKALARAVLGLLKQPLPVEVRPEPVAAPKPSPPAPRPAPSLPPWPSLVSAVLGTDPYVAAPAAGASPKSPIKGSLVDRSVPMLLLDLFEAQASGTLDLRRGKVRKLIHVMAGHPIFVQSNQRAETLGQMLVRRGLLTPQQNTAALELAKREHIKYGEALVRLGLMAEGQVMGELLAQTRAKIDACLRWRSGSYGFSDDPAIGSKVPRCVIDPVEAVVEGLRRTPDVEEAFAHLAACGARPIAALPRLTLYRDRFAAAFGTRVLDAIASPRSDGRGSSAAGPAAAEPLSVAEVIQKTGALQDAVLQLDVLLQAGMIELAAPRAATPEASQTIPRPSGEHLELERLAAHAPEPASEEFEPLEMEENSAVVLMRDLDRRPTAPRSIHRIDPDRVRVALQLIQATYLSLHAANHYEVLGVAPLTDPRSIDVAYQVKRKQFDLSSFRDMDLGEQHQHLDEIRAALDEAHAVLADAGRRAEYDRQLRSAPAARVAAVRDNALAAEEHCRRGEEALAKGDYAAAAEAFNRAFELDEQPEYRSLRALARFVAAGETPEAAEEAMVEVQSVLAMDPSDVAAHIAAAKISRALGHADEAAQHFRRALKIDPTCREAFDELEALLREGGAHAALEVEYRRTLHLLGAQDPVLAGALWRRLALLYRDDLRQPDRARLACEAGLKLSSEDRELQALLAEIDRATPERWPEAVLGYRSLLRGDPGQSDPLHELYRLHRAAGRHDAAFVAASAAVARGVAAAEEREIHERERSAAGARRPRPLAREHWELLRHSDDDAGLGALFDVMAPLCLKLHPLALERYDLGTVELRAAGALPQPFREELAAAIELLGVQQPELVVKASLGAELQALGVEPPLLVSGPGALVTEDPLALRFKLARALALLRPGVCLAQWRPRRVLRGYILAALSSSLPQLAVPDPDGLVGSIKEELGRLPGLAEAARRAVASLHKRFRHLNLADWQRGIQRTADRAGLLACADLPAAAALASSSVGCYAAEAPAGGPDADLDLLDFALSESYGELRSRLGLAL
jgi:CheY-like chemotaxis protein/tetratricopeptide (TPR) repeat protein